MSKLGKSITVCEFETMKKGKKERVQLSIIANVVEDFSLLTECEIANPPVINTSFEKIDLGKLRLNELTTKEIKNYHRSLRKVTKSKTIFPNEEALMRILYLATENATKKWISIIRNWGLIYSQIRILFDKRMDKFK